MISEQYDSRDYLPQGYYPWPDLISPHVEQMGKDMDSWIDEEYTHLSAKSREKYKRMRLHFCTARMLPGVTYEQIMPCNRFMLLYVVVDDQLEHNSPEENRRIQGRMDAILAGGPLVAGDNAAYRHLAHMRDEHSAYMTADWMRRFSEDLHQSFNLGTHLETQYKEAGHPPPLALFKVIREYSVLMYPYLLWAEIQAGFELPRYLLEHPVIRRLRSLMVRVIAWQNDFHSLPKELAKKTA